LRPGDPRVAGCVLSAAAREAVTLSVPGGAESKERKTPSDYFALATRIRIARKV
jgi:hypothetical protein